MTSATARIDYRWFRVALGLLLVGAVGAVSVVVEVEGLQLLLEMTLLLQLLS